MNVHLDVLLWHGEILGLEPVIQNGIQIPMLTAQKEDPSSVSEGPLLSSSLQTNTNKHLRITGLGHSMQEQGKGAGQHLISVYIFFSIFLVCGMWCVCTACCMWCLYLLIQVCTHVHVYILGTEIDTWCLSQLFFFLFFGGRVSH